MIHVKEEQFLRLGTAKWIKVVKLSSSFLGVNSKSLDKVFNFDQLEVGLSAHFKRTVTQTAN